MLALWPFFLIALVFAETQVPTAPKPVEAFVSALHQRKVIFTSFQQGIFNEDTCPGENFTCLAQELTKIGIRSSSDFSQGANLISYLAQRKIKKSPDCAGVCLANIYAELSVALYTYAREFALKTQIVYTDLPKDNTETELLQAMEDLQNFRNLQAVHDKLLMLSHNVDPAKIFREDLSARFVEVSSKLGDIAPKALLKDSFLADLSEDDPVYSDFLQIADADPKKKREHLESLAQFRKVFPEEIE